jgi:hypothetical protein
MTWMICRERRCSLSVNGLHLTATCNCNARLQSRPRYNQQLSSEMEIYRNSRSQENDEPVAWPSASTPELGCSALSVTFVSAEPSKRCDLSIYQKGENQYKSLQPFGITPRRGGGKARLIPTTAPPAAAAPKSRPRKGCAAPGRPPTSSPVRPPARRKDKSQTPREATDAGAKCRRDPTASAAVRSPGAVLPSSGTRNGPETLPIPKPNCPPTPRGYAEREG